MGGIYIGWLADAARLTGYPVVEVENWRIRGHGGFRAVELVTGHHTADGPGEYPSLRVVRDGRAGLAGPLCNEGLARSGTIFVVAAGVAWHAGASRYAGFTDINDEAIGIEAESAGTKDDWTPEQRDAYPRLVAANLYYMRRGADRFCGHKECALPVGRKIDPAFWDLNAFRSKVAWYLADPLGRIPRFVNPAPAAPAPTARRGDTDMPIELHYFHRDDETGAFTPDPDGLWFRGHATTEVGTGVIEAAYVRWGSQWGTASWRIVAWSADRPLGEPTPEEMAAQKDWWQLPPGTRQFTVEGKRDDPGVVLSARVLERAAK